MYCLKCGTLNAPNAQVCANCGNQLPCAGAQPAYQQPANRLTPDNPALQAIKRSFSSPVFLILLIVFSINVLWRIPDSFYILFGNLDNYNYQNISIVVNMFSFLEALVLPLILIGAWMLFGSAVNKSRADINKSALTVVKVGIIICMILAGFRLVLDLMNNLATVSYDYYRWDIDGVITLIYSFAAIPLMFIYRAKLIGALGSTKQISATGTVGNRGYSLFAAIIGFAQSAYLLYCMVYVISVLIGYFDAASIAEISVSYLLRIAVYFLISLTLLQCRRRIREAAASQPVR